MTEEEQIARQADRIAYANAILATTAAEEAKDEAKARVEEARYKLANAQAQYGVAHLAFAIAWQDEQVAGALVGEGK